VSSETDKWVALDLRKTKTRLQHPAPRAETELWQVWYFGTSISSVASKLWQSPRTDCQFAALILLADIAKHLRFGSPVQP
jgi:hypothetical protein